MAQLVQSRPSVASFGPSEFLAGIPASSNEKLPVQRLSVKKLPAQPSVVPGVIQDITEIELLEAELNEHRYNLERKVEQKTEQLVKRIALLKSCNSTLCDKLSQAQKEIAALRKQLAASMLDPIGPDSGSVDCGGQPAPLGM